MINTLLMSLKIDVVYSVNSFIYVLRKLPVFRDLLTDSVYKSKKIKSIVMIIGILLSLGRFLFFKFLYFGIIYLIASNIGNNLVNSFVHIYILFTIIGLFINNKLLITDKKKYFSIVLFGVDAKEYMRSCLWWSLLLSFIFNSISFLAFSKYIDYSFLSGSLLVVFNLLCRIVGEAFNIWFYKRNNYLWHVNTKLYFSIVLGLLGVSLLPIFNIFISYNLFLVIFILFVILVVVSLIYLYNISDYKLIFKRINTKNAVINSNHSDDYSRQALLNVRDKDKIIDNKKIQGKKGYDLFNTIFFERHREILYRSAKKYALAIFLIFLILSGLVVNYSDVKLTVFNFLSNHLAYFVIIMYFINRGSVITQAMFYNCDHAMLSYNFYRYPDVLLNLFKKRLVTVAKVNLIPAVVMAVFIDILLYLSGFSLGINYLMVPLFIISLSIFFSVHYLVIYYLFQPYNKDMQFKRVSYSIVSLSVYFISYYLKDVVMSPLLFSMFSIFFTVGYILLALYLVYKKAPSTFKLYS